MDGFLAGMLFMFGILVLFGLFMIVGYFVMEFICNFEPKKYLPKPFDPNISEEEQDTFVHRFGSFGFDEIPQFLYGLRGVPARNKQMKFTHRSRCYIIVSKNITKKCFRFEIKYKNTLLKTFDDWGAVGDFCWNLNISYRDNPDLIVKTLEVEKREALAAGDFE